MSHVASVFIPDLASAALEGPEGALMLFGTVTVYVTFSNDNSTYAYYRVPATIAISVANDPSANFEQIRYWSGGYKRVR
jgi:hypothetical protein